MNETPKTNQALAEILERDGELSEDNAPAALVNLCKELERTAVRMGLELTEFRKERLEIMMGMR